MSQLLLLLRDLAPLMPELWKLLQALHARALIEGRRHELKGKIQKMTEAYEKNDMAEFNRLFNS